MPMCSAIRSRPSPIVRHSCTHVSEHSVGTTRRKLASARGSRSRPSGCRASGRAAARRRPVGRLSGARGRPRIGVRRTRGPARSPARSIGSARSRPTAPAPGGGWRDTQVGQDPQALAEQPAGLYDEQRNHEHQPEQHQSRPARPRNVRPWTVPDHCRRRGVLATLVTWHQLVVGFDLDMTLIDTACGVRGDGWRCWARSSGSRSRPRAMRAGLGPPAGTTLLRRPTSPRARSRPGGRPLPRDLPGAPR